MLDIRRIRENPEAVNQLLQRRDSALTVNDVLAVDVKRRELMSEEESLRSERNQVTKAIGQAKQQGGDAGEAQARAKEIAQRIKVLEAEKVVLAEQQEAMILGLPNLPLDEVPLGDESKNEIVRQWGDEFKDRAGKGALAHWDLGVNLGALDFERGVRVAQSRFCLLRGEGARLNRALKNFMLDTHSANGYEEMLPPFLVNHESMVGTGQLPKFASDMFRCQDDALYLNPTGEVPITNLYRDEVLAEEQLPMKFAGYTTCFRREAGSAGKDTRGLIRQHQFDKVELVKLVRPERSLEEHEVLVKDAERILQLLELPYRVMILATGDLGFSAAKCYDLEVWLPGQQEYREISSCSLFQDFQARRIGLKYRPADGGKLVHLHTINGSGLAVGRTLIAVLENYQVSPNEVLIPKVLQPYFANGATSIENGQF